jgi:DNA repair exonuclease SbcCD nuclease subunit
MPLTLMHIADLHLERRSRERQYGFGVLKQVVAGCAEKQVDALLLCGDIFNTLKDAEELRDEFRDVMAAASCEIFLLPGNHEELERGRHGLEALDFGKARLIATKPYSLTLLGQGEGAWELLSIPHQADCSGYRDWDVPSKQARWRVAMAHGLVVGMAYGGPEGESGAGALDPDIFVRFGVDYAACGHVHARPAPLVAGGSLVAYSGSARVWRSGETGPRGGLLVRFADGPQASFLPFSAAGEYRRVEVPVELNGQVGEVHGSGAWSPADFLDFRLSGVVEEDAQANEVERQLLARYGERVRRLEIDTAGLLVVGGIRSEPAVSRFLTLWEARRPAPAEAAYPIWLAARSLGLRELKAHLERRR